MLPSKTKTSVGSLLIDGLEVLQNDGVCSGMNFIEIKKAKINRLTVRNADIVRNENVSGGNLIKLCDGVEINKLRLFFDIDADGLDGLVCGEGKYQGLQRTT